MVIRAVAAACKLVGPPRTRRDSDALELANQFDAEVVSAFAELVNNICLHGAKSGDQWDITVEIDPQPTALTARITEYGQPFAMDEVPEPDLDALPEGGMGIHICRQVLDSLHYEPGPPNVWTLKKTYVEQQTLRTANVRD